MIWRARIEFGEWIPGETKINYFFGGLSRTEYLIGLNDVNDIGSMCKITIDSANWKGFIYSLEQFSNYPYKPEKDFKNIKITEGYFHVLPKQDGYGTYYWLHFIRSSNKIEITLTSSWD